LTIQANALDAIADLSPAGAASQKTENKGALGRDEFLKLLITQLKNQDPLNPMQSVEFTAQLAQFSSLEQLFNIGESMEGIKTSLLLQQGDQLVHYIGKNVKTAGDVVAVREGEAGPASYRLDGDGEVWVDIYDGRGALVRKLHVGFQHGGVHHVPWDGKDGAGNTVADGNYRFDVTARDVDGYRVSSQTYMSGEVTGVKYENGKAFLVIGDRQVMPESILEVNQL
jgi:flagellar basal-body rod modification protein FlgD